MRKLKLYLLSLAFFLVLAFVVFWAVELPLRYWVLKDSTESRDHVHETSYMPVKFKGNYSGTFWGVPFKTNQYGFRDEPDFPKTPEPGEYRILSLGDSIGFGYCNESRVIAIEHTFSSVLEDELNRSGLGSYDRVEVLNLSVSGYDTLQEVEFLKEKGLAYGPDVVLIAYCLTYLMLASRELFLFRKHSGWDAYRSAADMVYRSAVYRSHLVRFVWHRVPNLAARPSAPQLHDAAHAGPAPATRLSAVPAPPHPAIPDRGPPRD